MLSWVYARRSPHPAAVDRRGAYGVVHRPRRHWAGARLFLFRGRARSALGGQAAHPRRGPPHGGELRQAAGAAAAEWLTLQAATDGALSLAAGYIGLMTETRCRRYASA